MLVKRFNVALFGILLQRQQKDDIVREYDDLPVLRFLHQALRDVVAPFKVERGNRVVKHDGRRIISGTQFGKERRNRDTALFALAYDFWNFDAGISRKDELVIEDTFRAAYLFQIDLNMIEFEIIQFVLEALFQAH